MHPTADTLDFIFGNRSGRRVMPGVRLLGRCGITADGMRGRAEWCGGLVQASPAVVCGLTSLEASGGGHGAGCRSPFTERAAWRALKMTQSNKRMHATRDTSDFMIRERCGRARDARR